MTRAGANPALRREVRSVVKGVLQHEQELKVTNVNIAATDLTTAGLVQPISQHIIVGDTFDTRDGDSIVAKSLEVVWNCFDSTTSVQTRLCRIIIFSDSMNTGVLPAVTDVLLSASPTSGYNPVNLLNKRFKIYVDDKLPIVTTSAAGAHLKHYQFRLNKKICYLNTTFATASNGKDSFWCLTIADTVAVGATRNVLAFNWRFTDS